MSMAMIGSSSMMNVGRHLLGDLPADLVEQLIELADIDFEDGGGLVEAETLDGHQQERLTGAGVICSSAARRGAPSLRSAPSSAN